MKSFVRYCAILLALLVQPVQAKGPEEGPFILHRAYKSIYKGDNYEIFHPNYVWDRIDPLCSRSLSFRISVVFDVPPDLQLDEEYLTRTLFREGPLPDLAIDSCPNATSIFAQIYFKDKPLGRNFEITSPTQIKQQGREKEFAIISMQLRGVDNQLLGERSYEYMNYSNKMRLKESVSYNDVIVYNENGLRTPEQIAAEEDRKRQQQASRQREINDSAARNAWFAKEKAASNWPGADDWMMDIYMMGGRSTAAAPPRSVEQNRAMTWPVNSWFAIAAYVELSHKRCGATTPNGASEVTITREDQYGVQTDSVTIHADSSLAGPYVAFRNNNGGYNALNVIGLNRIQKGYEPMFSRWSCGGAEHARFIRGLAKWDRETD